MKKYDYNLIKKIVDTFTSVTEVESVSMGFHEDWFWTAETIYENGGFTERFLWEKSAGGVNGSTWATPVIEIELATGETHIFNCYESDSIESDIFKTISNMALFSGGVLSGPMLEYRLQLEVKDFKNADEKAPN